MGSKTLEHLRVVIHINEEDPEDQNESFQNTSFKYGSKTGLKRNINGQVVSPSSPVSALQSLDDNSGWDNNMKAEILLINEKSLQLNLISTEEDDGPYTNISHKMQFDHVSDSPIDMIKCELAIVMDELLLKRKNSCIMRFSIKQEMDITIFFDLLVTFINKRIYHQKYKLQYVKLECLDIAANVGDFQNLPIEKGFAMRANIADSSDDDCNNNAVTFRYSNAKNEFRSTRDLLMWLLNEYRYKFADSKGHEKLQFSFSIVDHHQNQFKVKLSLFNIFLNLMSTEDRNHWHHYMDHMGEGCQGLDCNFVHSGLTISLSSHIEGTASENILLLFYVPTNIKMTADTIEMLQMAYSVIINKRRKLLSLNKNVNFNRRFSMSSENCWKCFLPKRGDELNNDIDTDHKKIRRTLPPSISYNNNKTTLSRPSPTDFNTLSGWYHKIDECFEKTCQLHETYFNRFFKLKIKEISSNIKTMCNSLESLYIQQSERDIVELPKDQIELHGLFESYRNVRTLFQQLSEDIKSTDFHQVLKVYLETKTFDLNKQALVLKQKNLEWCQQHLNFTFDYLYSELQLELGM